jgi:nitrogen fixation-related uncharacterized protein
MTAAAIVASGIGVITVAIVLALFLWAAREDGRDQERRDARRVGTLPARRP